MALSLIKHSRKKTVKNRHDKGSMILLWLMISLCLTAGFFIAGPRRWTHTSGMIAMAGYVVIAAGAIIRWRAILQLSIAFTVDVAVSEGQKLKTDGLYKKVRHPSYLGLLLILTGLSVAMSSPWSVAVVVIPMILTISYRINVEEKLLSDEFGEAYARYRSRSWRLLPGIY